MRLRHDAGGMSAEEPLALLPADWRGLLASCEVSPVRTGMSSAWLFRLRRAGADDLYLKIGQGAEAAELRGEIERTLWLAARGVRVPAIVRSFDGGLVVAAMMTALPGDHPSDCRRPVGEVIDVMARALASLHAHSPANADCPFDESVAARLARAQVLMTRGEIEPGHFAERNRGRAPQQIYDRLLATRPATEDLVLVHGDATFDNILIDAAGNVGFLDCGRCGRGDRGIDLACIIADIEQSFGTEWVGRFLRSYGAARWEPAKALFFSDLYELF
jgi:aminoglycoside 3'-phosphotransferase-2